jgi:hypothetical protein
MSWDVIIDKLIRQAMVEGKFENLRGHGQPLKLDGDENDPEWAVSRLLKNNDARPPWLDEQVDIRTTLEKERQNLRRTWAYVQAHPGALGQWARAERRFRKTADDLNRRIRDFNLRAPAERLQLTRIDVETELTTAQHAR